MTKEEAFQSLLAGNTPVNDVLVIDPETRTITVPPSEKKFGTFSERNVERKYFECPKIILDNIDLSKCKIFVNYISVAGKPGQYLCEDMHVSEDGQKIEFTWLLSGNLFDENKAGTVFFAVQAKTTDGNSVFCTSKASGEIGDTVDEGSYIEEQNADVILQIIARLDSIEGGAVSPEVIQEAVEDYFKKNPIDIDISQLATKNDLLGFATEIPNPRRPKATIKSGKYNACSSDIHTVNGIDILYGFNGSSVIRSANNEELGSPNILCVSPTNTGTVNFVKKLDNGELLAGVENVNGVTKLFKGTAEKWNQSKLKFDVTWKEVLSIPNDKVRFSLWFGISIYKGVIVLGEYGNHNIARDVYLSRDNGDSWSKIFTAEVDNIGAGVHIHDVCYDPYSEVIWVCTGDGIYAQNVFFSYDFGKTWNKNYGVGESPSQFTSILPLPNCVLFTTDNEKHMSVYRCDRVQLLRGKKHVDLVEAYSYDNNYNAESPIGTNGCVGYGKNACAYFGWAERYDVAKTKSPVIGTKDGYNFFTIWENDKITESDGGYAGIYGVYGVSEKGNIAVSVKDKIPDTTGYLSVVMKSPEWVGFDGESEKKIPTKVSELQNDSKYQTETEVKELIKQNGSGSGGTTDYADLTNKPSINGHELAGNQTTEDLGIVIPTTLPNPHALKFTGGATGSYDGSEEITVNIPTGSGTAELQPLTFSGAVNAKYDGTEPVEVEIPSGGESGEEPWKKIADIVVKPHDNKFVYKQLPNYSEILIEFDSIEGDSEITRGFNVFLNGEGTEHKVINTIRIENSGNERKSIAYIHLKYNNLFWNIEEVEQLNYTVSNKPLFEQETYHNYLWNENLPATELVIASFVGLKSGTIKIYAR